MKRMLLFLALFLPGLLAQAQNYDEAKVPAYTLPEVLKLANGRPIRNKAAWKKRRRPEVLALFENHVYGQMPLAYDSLTYTVTNEEPHAMQGKARLQEITLTTWNGGRQANIHLVLFTPNHRAQPVPAFLLINNRDPNNIDPTRATKSDFWPAEMVVASGYAAAAFHVSDAAPDHKDHYQQGALQLYPELLQAENGPKAIGAWAWAASRVLDYFERTPGIDARRVALVGHSRGGKAALWAGAQDQRFALVVSNCSGSTGAALARRRFGETVRVINTNFPHWFADTYKQYNDNEAGLPVDQHLLIALLAPRPVYVTSATEDLWADPKGTYLSLVHAQPAYALYRKDPQLPPDPPATNRPIIRSPVGYHIREGKHDMTAYDWKQFLQFADYHFRGQK